MPEEVINLKRSTATGYVVALGPVNLVWVSAKNGMVGCGAFDVRALEKFGYPAARVKPPSHLESVRSVEDLLCGEIKETNKYAQDLGIRDGMTGKEALDLLS